MNPFPLPLSWDNVGFPEFQQVLIDACGRELAGPLLKNSQRAALAWENPGTWTTSTQEVNKERLRLVSRHLRAFSGRESASLRTRLTGVHGMYVICAVSALGAVPEFGRPDSISVPGLYDREVDWLSRQLFEHDGRVPTWSEVSDALHTARRCLIAGVHDPAPDDSPFMKLRKKSVLAADLGAAYVPMARDLTNRLLRTSIEESTTIRHSHLASFLDTTENIFESLVRKMKSVLRTLPSVNALVDHSQFLQHVISVWDVFSLVNSLTIDSALAIDPCVQDLTAPTSDSPGEFVDLRTQPMISIGNSAFLALPRRIACDRHELFDHAIARLFRTQKEDPGTYSTLRANMLDRVIADSLARILPGCRAVVGQEWIIDGTRYERDVVVFYEDIAICIETKAPRMVASMKSSRRDVVEVLRGEMAEGVRQVTSIADALEASAATLASGDAVPSVRRAYRLVASFNTWWGIDLAARALQGVAVLPALDSAMLTSAEKFICYEKLFDMPADFVAYLDHRLAHQRRDWIVVADEFEMVGGYYTNPHDDWRHRPRRRGIYMVKPAFQDDVDQTIRAAYTNGGRRSRWLQRKHCSLIDLNLAALEANRPDGWLQAFSALSRLPARTQLLLEAELSARRNEATRQRGNEATRQPGWRIPSKCRTGPDRSSSFAHPKPLVSAPGTT